MLMNKRLIAGVMLFLSIGSGFAADRVEPVRDLIQGRVPENGYGIVPMPYEVKANAGNPFVITKDTVIIGRAEETKNCAIYLQQRLRKSCGLTLKRVGKSEGKAIVLTVSDDAVAFSENDAYRLESSADKITISAKTERGLFYGVQSLLQLLPPAVYGDKVQTGLELKVPALSINDKPSMDRMRGLHVDISRHFRTKEELLKIIDSMAMHKLNTLHIHLTDDQGWRIEIKAYPKLTTVGAIGCRSNPKAPAQFLTQEDARAICAYAKSRYISIIPEIDMPGHMGAAIRAYPELKNPKELRKPGKVIRGDAPGIEFAQKVLTEVNNLFNPEYIHIGVDEVNFRSKKEIYTEKELVAFATEITTFIKEDLKKTPIVWDDAYGHGFNDKKTVAHWWRFGKGQWWNSNKKTTADYKLNQNKQPFIISPAYWTYFDMPNVKPKKGRDGWAKAISPAEVYNWDPFGDMSGVTADTRKIALGAIACTWSESIKTMKDFGDRTFPRLAPYSERIWRGGKLEAPSILSWPDYRDQVLIPFQLKRYDALGVWYWSKDNPQLLLDLEDARKTLPMPPKKRAKPRKPRA
jgi:hexosaminidase